jgi:hypothetical protein
MVREIHIEHVGNRNTKSCSLLHSDAFCCPPFIESPSNCTSCANNVVINCKLLGDIFYSNIFMEPTCNNTLIGLEVKSWACIAEELKCEVGCNFQSSEFPQKKKK